MTDSTCLTDKQIEEAARGSTGADAEIHLASCSRCRDAIERVRANNDFLGAFRHHLRRAAQANETAITDPDAVPGYQLLDRLHRGGQGIVYKALQQSTGKTVAVKILREGPFAGPTDRLRLEREVHALARLSHPHIVTVHDSGLAAGCFYLVTNYVEGVPLDEWIAAHGPPAPRAPATAMPHPRDFRARLVRTLRLLSAICDGVAAAHLRGVIHRDLKPSNILVDARDQPHILDFGLAKLVEPPTDTDEPQTLTRTGHFFGSLPWASPEQADGAAAEVDVRSDVYALGVILFHALTGSFPYDVSGSVRRVLDRIIHTEPARPSAVNPALDHELDTIVLKALAKEKLHRYQSVESLARDLRHYLAGEPIEAKRGSTWYVVRKSLRRHRLPVTAALIFLALLVGFAIDRARQARRLRNALDDTSAALTIANIERGRAEGAAGNLALAERILWPLEDVSPDVPFASYRLDPVNWDQYNEAHWALWELYSRQPAIASCRLDRPGARLHFTNDGRLFAASVDTDGAPIWTFELDRGARAKRDCILRLPDRTATCTTLSPDAELVAAGADDGSLRIWDRLAESVETEWHAHDSPVIDLAFSPAGEIIASCAANDLHLWGAGGARLLASAPLDGTPSRIAISPDGRALAVALPDRSKINVYALPYLAFRAALDVTAVTEIRDPPTLIRDLAFAPDSRLLAAACYRYAALWDLADTRLLARHWHELELDAVAFTHDGDALISACGQVVSFWSTGSHDPLHRYAGHLDVVRSLAVSPATGLIASAADDGTVRLWEPRPRTALTQLPREDVHSIRFSPDATRLALCGQSADPDTAIELRSAVGGELLETLPAPPGDLSTLAFSPDSRLLAVASYETPAVRLWNLVAHQYRDLALDEGARGGIASLAFDPTGAFLAAGHNQDGKLFLWTTDFPDRTLTFSDHAGRIPALAFSPDGRTLASADHAGNIILRHISTPQETMTFPAHRGPVRALRFSPDGNSLFSAGDDGLIRRWRTRDRQLLAELPGHRGPVFALALSANGAILASGGYDGVIRLWSTHTGRLLAALECNSGVIASLAFNGHSPTLAFGAFGGPAGLWDLSHYQRHLAGNRGGLYPDRTPAPAHVSKDAQRQ